MPIMPWRRIENPADLETPKGAGDEERLIIDQLLTWSDHPCRFPGHWKAKFSPSFNALDLGSRNHAAMAAMLGYALAPDAEIGGITPRLWWVRLLGWETGAESPPPPRNCGYLGNNEPNSNTYDGWQYGPDAVVRELALKRGDRELIELTARKARAAAAMMALMAVPAWPKGSPKATVVGPYVAQAGARSTPFHLDDSPGSLCLAEMIRWPGARHPWPLGEKPGHALSISYWYLQAFARLSGDTGISEEDAEVLRSAIRGDLASLDRAASWLSGCRWMSWDDTPFLEIRRWPDVVAAIHGRVVNFNTGAILASVLRMNGEPAAFSYPWSAAPGAKLAKPKGMEPGRASWTDREIVVRGHKEERLPIPSDPPLRHWILDKQGIRLAGSAPPPKPIEPPPVGEEGAEMQPTPRERIAAVRKQVMENTLAALAELERIERSL